jgi:putative ABC transport system permease protein
MVLAFTCFTLLATLLSPFYSHTTAGPGKAATIGITALYGKLPVRYAQEISRMPGIVSVRYGGFMPILCRRDPNTFATLNSRAGIGGHSPLAPALVKSLSSSKLKKWRKTRNGMLVGKSLAKSCHWHVGQLLSLKEGMIKPIIVKADIVGIYDANSTSPLLNQIAVLHYDYLNSLRPASMHGVATSMTATVANPKQAAQLAAEIDAHFANLSPPTESSANTVTQGALAQFGNVLRIIEFVMAAIFACTLIVTVNVAAHAAAERRAQFALFRVLGFSRLWISLLAAIELLYVVILGCGLGIALGLALLHWVIGPLLGPLFSGLFSAPSSALKLAPAIAAGIVIVSLLIPAWEIFRLRASRLSAP